MAWRESEFLMPCPLESSLVNLMTMPHRMDYRQCCLYPQLPVGFDPLMLERHLQGWNTSPAEVPPSAARDANHLSKKKKEKVLKEATQVASDLFADALRVVWDEAHGPCLGGRKK